MKKMLFVLFIFSFLFAAERKEYHDYISPICDIYHDPFNDFCLFLPPKLEEWKFFKKNNEDLVSVKYKDSNFFSIFLNKKKYKFDCRLHYRYEKKLIEIAKKIAKKRVKNLEIKNAKFVDEKELEMREYYIDSSPYIFIEGVVDGKKSFHFITSYENRWFDFFYTLEDNYEGLLKKLIPFFEDVEMIYGDEELDMVYSDQYKEYEPSDVMRSFFMLFLFDISAKAEEKKEGVVVKVSPI